LLGEGLGQNFISLQKKIRVQKLRKGGFQGSSGEGVPFPHRVCECHDNGVYKGGEEVVEVEGTGGYLALWGEEWSRPDRSH